MTKLSVNINKIATLRNSRGGDLPNVVEAARNAERFGAQGITVHPRPDERHIRYKDVYDLKKVITTEFNIEGNPIDRFIDLVLDVVPTQVTLVPDAVDALTSNGGWDTIANKAFLTEVIARFKAKGIRTSIFIDARPEMISAAAEAGADGWSCTPSPMLRCTKKTGKQRLLRSWLRPKRLCGMDWGSMAGMI